MQAQNYYMYIVHTAKFSLANPESPVPLPLKNGDVFFTMHQHCIRTEFCIRSIVRDSRRFIW